MLSLADLVRSCRFYQVLFHVFIRFVHLFNLDLQLLDPERTGYKSLSTVIQNPALKCRTILHDFKSLIVKMLA